MNNQKIEELRVRWGDKPCFHPALRKNVDTHDKVCTSCGRVVYSGNRPNPVNDFFKDIL
jgi:hypothetical protein